MPNRQGEPGGSGEPGHGLMSWENLVFAVKAEPSADSCESAQQAEQSPAANSDRSNDEIQQPEFSTEQLTTESSKFKRSRSFSKRDSSPSQQLSSLHKNRVLSLTSFEKSNDTPKSSSSEKRLGKSSDQVDSMSSGSAGPTTFGQRLLCHLQKLPSWMLGLSGFTLFNEGRWSARYRAFMVLVAAALVVLALPVPAALSRIQYCQMVTESQALGVLLGLVLLRMEPVELFLGPVQRPLEVLAWTNGFWDAWQVLSLRRLGIVTVLWVCMTLSRLTGLLLSDCSPLTEHFAAPEILHIVTFTISGALVMLLLFAEVHVCGGLELAVDDYCVSVFQQMDVTRSIHDWNVLEALIRRAAATTDWSFLAVGTSVVGSLLLTGIVLLQAQDTHWVDVGHLSPHCTALWCGWFLPPLIMLLYTICCMAAVTERCLRVPALVNSWPNQEGKAIDHDRQFLVHHIILSSAGFYVKGVRLSASVAIKFAYLSSGVLFTLFTRTALQA